MFVPFPLHALRRSSATIAVLFAAGFADGTLFAANPDARQSPKQAVQSAEALLEEALACEIYGLDAEREALLSKAESLAPDLPAVKWQRGMLLVDGKWTPAEEVAVAPPSDSLLAEYVAKRDAATDTPADHLALARWCQEKKLFEQERAHLVRVLKHEPNHAHARVRLGYIRIEDEWISREEIARAVAEEAKAQASIEKHRAYLKRLAGLLGDQDPAVRSRTAARVRAFRDPTSIPALEAMIASVSEEASLAVLESLVEMPESEATRSLARFAAMSPYLRVRNRAGKALAHRPLDQFVPALIDLMTAPIKATYQAERRYEDARLVYRFTFLREGRRASALHVHDVVYTNSQPTLSPIARGTQDDDHIEIAFGYDFEVQSTLARASVGLANLRTNELNANIASVLEEVTGENLGTEPQDWWTWWDQHNELEVQGEKPTDMQYSWQSKQTRFQEVDPYRPRRISMAQKTISCFAAGTPVLTNRGEVAIEQMRVGDLVLAQDVESGEIAFKPVLETTVRPPAELLRVEHERGSFRCTGGHPFWVSGEGWVHAKRLKSGMELHTLDGSVRVSDVVSDGEEATYNLIVADFANYFVTDARVLSHDNSSRQSTDAVVPGLQQK